MTYVKPLSNLHQVFPTYTLLLQSGSLSPSKWVAVFISNFKIIPRPDETGSNNTN